jgi:tetratricopeptide (TPR) repeat protein
VSWSITKIAVALPVALLLTLAGCATGPGGGQPEPSSEAVDYAAYTPNPDLSTGERIREALRLLERGNVGQARAELAAFLEQRPSSSIGKELMAQIDTPVEEYFPAEYVRIDLESGETLSTISKQYLGSVYQFFALARYNNIEVPRNIRVGQEIRVPLTDYARKAIERGERMDQQQAEAPTPESEPVEEAAPEAPEIPASLASAEELQALVDAGDYEQAINLLEASNSELGAEYRDVAASAYLASADQLAASNGSLAAHRYVKAGELLVAQGNKDKAFEAYRGANSAAPEDANVEATYVGLQRELTDRYHREASMAFRSQELDKAITIWDRVLVIDPDHANARIYRSQAIELKERLAELE